MIPIERIKEPSPDPPDFYIGDNPDSPCGLSRRERLIKAFHLIITKEGLVLHPTNIDIPAKLIPGPVYDRDKYNKCSISIRYCGSLLPHAWLIDPNTSCKSAMQQRATLLNLLVQLRGLYPSAKILGASELDGKELYSKNIIVSDTMNVLREELSNMS